MGRLAQARNACLLAHAFLVVVRSGAEHEEGAANKGGISTPN